MQLLGTHSLGDGNSGNTFAVATCETYSAAFAIAE
ncbi:hypothetical protein FIV06_01710 [Labrenzia sp. THAF191b]|nr:hypothetical protein FIV06_01710 [Labrenzia sp. THAF191b]QFT02430.1 hypothetical protein FIV05_01710 [Labrenzia sp. THAF191a]QFT13972.1 hypothetical protein FIV03_01715 [Labrenzia sp. THAF187b]